MSGNGTTASPWDALKSAIYHLGLAKNQAERNVRMQAAMSIGRDIERGVAAEFGALQGQMHRMVGLLRELTGGSFVRFEVLFEPLLAPGERIDVQIRDSTGAPVAVVDTQTLLVAPANVEPFVAMVKRADGTVHKNTVKIVQRQEPAPEQSRIVLG